METNTQKQENTIPQQIEQPNKVIPFWKSQLDRYEKRNY